MASKRTGANRTTVAQQDKRRKTVHHVMEVTLWDEQRVKALLSQARWNISEAMRIFIRRSEIKALVAEADENELVGLAHELTHECISTGLERYCVELAAQEAQQRAWEFELRRRVTRMMAICEIPLEHAIAYFELDELDCSLHECVRCHVVDRVSSCQALELTEDIQALEALIADVQRIRRNWAYNRMEFVIYEELSLGDLLGSFIDEQICNVRKSIYKIQQAVREREYAARASERSRRWQMISEELERATTDEDMVIANQKFDDFLKIAYSRSVRDSSS